MTTRPSVGCVISWGKWGLAPSLGTFRIVTAHGSSPPTYIYTDCSYNGTCILLSRSTFCSLRINNILAKMATADLPKNAHVSRHPCLQAKLSQLRSAKTGCRDVQTLVHEIALMVGYEALGAGLTAQQDGTVCPYSTLSLPFLSPLCVVEYRVGRMWTGTTHEYPTISPPNYTFTNHTSLPHRCPSYVTTC